jgi:hypothetical protein
MKNELLAVIKRSSLPTFRLLPPIVETSYFLSVEENKKELEFGTRTIKRFTAVINKCILTKQALPANFTLVLYLRA